MDSPIPVLLVLMSPINIHRPVPGLSVDDERFIHHPVCYARNNRPGSE